jgi:hypothetical protein
MAEGRGSDFRHHFYYRHFPMAEEPIGNMVFAISLPMENAVDPHRIRPAQSAARSAPAAGSCVTPAASLTGWQALQHHALTTLISRMETSRDKTEKENCVPVSLFHPGNRLFLSGDVAVPLRRRSWSAQATFPVSPEPGTKDG